MVKYMKYLVITTINPPNVGSLFKLREFLSDWEIVVVGDKKTPGNWEIPGVIYLSVEDQGLRFSKFSNALPFNSYSRKNIGYLYAIKNGATVIAETDDDNYPYPTFLANTINNLSGHTIESDDRWINLYSFFTEQKIWPRGFSLRHVIGGGSIEPLLSEDTCVCNPVIRQYLADGDSDVDAIYRLTVNKDVKFEQDKTVFLQSGQICPFNSQNTVWLAEAFPLLYLPSHVSFRMTDIWRSFVAQVCVYAASNNISFSSATMYQERNIHDFLRDFEQEIPGYLHNEDIVDCLLNLDLTLGNKGYLKNIYTCYEALHKKLDIIPKEELDLLSIWIEQIS